MTQPSPAARDHLCEQAPIVLAVGPWQCGEFARLCDDLVLRDQWQTADSISAALTSPSINYSPPDLILVAQPRPGTISQPDVEHVCCQWPLARIVVVAGSWCEGELRTGQPPQGVVRLYWYEFGAWWRAALAQVAAGNAPPWSEPLFDARAAQSIPHSAPASGQPMVAIDAVDYETIQALQQGLGSLGWKTIWHPRHRPEVNRNNDQSTPIAAGIWDGGQLDGTEPDQLHSFCNRLRAGAAPVIALLDFPRREHAQQMRDLGAAAMFAKPYQLSLLHQELTRLLAPPIS